MARFTIRELDALPIKGVLSLSGIEGLKVDLIAGVQQRENMVEAHEAWTSTLDAETRDSAHWGTDTRSNFDLYVELRANKINFEHVADEPSFTVEELDSMSDEAIMSIANHGGIDLQVEDTVRDEMLRTHAAWVETLDLDLKEAFVGDQAARSNWELYSEIRINGAVPQHAPSRSISMAQPMSPGL